MKKQLYRSEINCKACGAILNIAGKGKCITCDYCQSVYILSESEYYCLNMDSIKKEYEEICAKSEELHSTLENYPNPLENASLFEKIKWFSTRNIGENLKKREEKLALEKEIDLMETRKSKLYNKIHQFDLI